MANLCQKDKKNFLCLPQRNVSRLILGKYKVNCKCQRSCKSGTFSNTRTKKQAIYWICEPNKLLSQILKIIKYGFKKSGKKVNLKQFIFISFSSFFYILDIILQKFKIYNMYIHVFSEIVKIFLQIILFI